MGKVVKLVAGLVCVLLFGAAGVVGTEYLLGGESAAEDGGSAPEATRVGVAAPETRRIEETVTAVGTLRPLRMVELQTSVAGRITEVAVESGAAVAEGDLIVQLDDRAERAAVTEAEATLEETRQARDRVRELARRETAAQQQLEQAEAAFSRAETQLMAARAALEDRAVLAPFAGTLGVVDLEPGAVIAEGTTITRLVDLSAVELDMSLPERYYDRVRPGQGVRVHVPAYPDRTFSGEVTVRAPEIDAGSRSFALRARIDNPEGRLAGGMFADSALVLGAYEGLALPDDAIISEGLTTYVYTVEDGQAARRDVQVGRSLGAMTEVTEGLSPEARVVVAGWDDLSEGAPVEVAQ